MKTLFKVVLGAVTCAVAVAGCNHTRLTLDDKAEMNRSMLSYHETDAVDAAAVRQRTIYPHHFMPGTAELNELGEDDLVALARYYRGSPGRLSVRQEDAPAALYEARVHTVITRLAKAGVSMGDMTVVDALPGGDGAAADRVMKVKDRMPTRPQRSEGRDWMRSGRP